MSDDVDAYFAALSPEAHAALTELRDTIRAAAPEATESIAYNMPAFRLGGRFLVSYAAFKRHYSLFPATDGMVKELGDEIAPYVFGRGTLRFTRDRPLSKDLLRRIVDIRLREVATEVRGRGSVAG
jgi:uncharacterized protein YdhG (YjbR/CyaY superfamily)